jgi:hypothetical protein
MNKFITSASFLSICLLSNCAVIKEYRGEPETWGKKGKTENSTEKAEIPTQKPANILRTVESISDASGTSVDKIADSNPEQGRTIEGFIEPDVTQLPDNKDLQESNNILPTTSPLIPKP